MQEKIWHVWGPQGIPWPQPGPEGWKWGGGWDGECSGKEWGVSLPWSCRNPGRLVSRTLTALGLGVGSEELTLLEGEAQAEQGS